MGEFREGVEDEGHQVEDGGQVLLAMAEIAFEVAALVFAAWLFPD